MAFPNFGKLPEQVRSKIWEMTLPLDEPGVYFFDPIEFHIPKEYLMGSDEVDEDDEDSDEEEDDGDDARGTFGKAQSEDGEHDDYIDMSEFRQVLLGFPAAMHVCRESRAVAHKVLDFKTVDAPSGSGDDNGNAGGDDEDEDEEDVATIDVPCRHYRPDLDVMFMSWGNLEILACAIRVAAQNKDDFYKNIRQLAVSSVHFFMQLDRELTYFVPLLSSLEKLHIVFGESPGSIPPPDDAGSDDSAGFEDDQDEARWGIAEWEENEAELSPGRSDTIVKVSKMMADIQEEIKAAESTPCIKVEASRLFRK